MAPDDAPALYAALAGDEVGRYLGGPDLLDSAVIGRVEATVRDGRVEKAPPCEYELGSWDPGDLVYAYAPARSARNGLAG